MIFTMNALYFADLANFTDFAKLKIKIKITLKSFD